MSHLCGANAHTPVYQSSSTNSRTAGLFKLHLQRPSKPYLPARQSQGQSLGAGTVPPAASGSRAGGSGVPALQPPPLSCGRGLPGPEEPCVGLWELLLTPCRPCTGHRASVSSWSVCRVAKEGSPVSVTFAGGLGVVPPEVGGAAQIVRHTPGPRHPAPRVSESMERMNE